MKVCAEHLGVESEHPGPKYNQSGAGVKNHLEQEDEGIGQLKTLVNCLKFPEFCIH